MKRKADRYRQAAPLYQVGHKCWFFFPLGLLEDTVCFGVARQSAPWLLEGVALIWEHPGPVEDLVYSPIRNPESALEKAQSEYVVQEKNKRILCGGTTDKIIKTLTLNKAFAK
ncbi:hypothetical protein NDU88_003636 [Pleurodeles waltl]|uniref:Uncharacterized protein n=1 Tax=Pleurodeles waltl TaxID=8319 RepID=A0AAV7WVE1_PLEWA|nr:hypothetical protein NDU88_003636 [Pleurodeles waltl]